MNTSEELNNGFNSKTFMRFHSKEQMAKHFNITVAYLDLWLNKDKPLNGWFVKEGNYDSELGRLQ